MADISWSGLVAKFGKRNATIGAVVVGVIVLGLIGNALSRNAGEDAAERAIEAATGGNVDIDSDDGSVTVKTDEGTWSASDKLPADWPTDVPVYAGAKVVSSIAGAGETGSGYFVSLESSAAVADVIAWYRAQVPAQGWDIAADTMMNGSLILSATKGERSLSATVTEEDGTVVIGLAVANQ